MPLSPPASIREHLHTRKITCQGFQRTDGLWDIEAHMEDTKSYSFESMERGKIPAAEPLHSMWLRLTVDDSLTVHAIEAVTDYAPFPSICPNITEAYQQIVGLQIGPGWSRKIKERLGGVHGCTHLTELLGPAATTAFQTIFPRKSEKDMRKLALVNTCHAFDENGPLIKALETETLARETKP